MKNRKTVLNVLRRLIFSLLIIAAYLLQCVLFPKTAFPFPVLILIPATLSVAMFELEYAGLFFGLLAGALWDLASPMPDGLLAFLFALAAGLTGLLSRYVLRNTLLGAMGVILTVSVLYTAIAIPVFSSAMDLYETRSVFYTRFLPAILTSVLLTVPCYFTVRWLSVRLRHEKIIN